MDHVVKKPQNVFVYLHLHKQKPQMHATKYCGWPAAFKWKAMKIKFTRTRISIIFRVSLSTHFSHTCLFSNTLIITIVINNIFFIISHHLIAVLKVSPCVWSPFVLNLVCTSLLLYGITKQRDMPRGTDWLQSPVKEKNLYIVSIKIGTETKFRILYWNPNSPLLDNTQKNICALKECVEDYKKSFNLVYRIKSKE